MAHGRKTGGRQKGTPNKITKEVREALQTIVEDELKEIPVLLDQLLPQDRLSILIKLLPYVIPKLKPEIPELPDQEISITTFLDEFKHGHVEEPNN